MSSFYLFLALDFLALDFLALDFLLVDFLLVGFSATDSVDSADFVDSVDFVDSLPPNRRQPHLISLTNRQFFLFELSIIKIFSMF